MQGLNKGLEDEFHSRVMGTVAGSGPRLADELQASTRAQVTTSLVNAGGTAPTVYEPDSDSSVGDSRIAPEDMKTLADMVAGALYTAMTGAGRDLALTTRGL